MSAFYGKQHKRRALLFYCLMLAFPVAQFCVFYIGVNFNSIRLAFGQYNMNTAGYDIIGFDNFVKNFKMFALQGEMQGALLNSVIVFAVNVIVGIPAGLFFSYYIFRKMRGAKLFKIILFLPSILSVMVLAVFFNYFTERALPKIWETLFHKQIQGLLSNPDTRFTVVIIFSLFVGLGVNVLMYVGAMANVSDSILESARLDGASPFREFLQIVVPMVFPTVITFTVVQVAGIFTNQLNLYAFYSSSADFSMYTIGYYLFHATQVATPGEYPDVAAMGIICTVIAVPLTLGVKKLMEKLGPSVER